MTRLNRCARIRAWLATQAIPASARDVMRAVEPKGDFKAIAASLSAMAKSGLVRANKVGRLLYYTAGRVPTSPSERRMAKTGRSQRILRLLASDRGYTVAEIRAQVDPTAPSHLVAASLFTLSQQGDIARATHGRTSCYARTQAIADQALADLLAARQARNAKPKEARKTAKKATRRATKKPAAAAPPKAPPTRPVPRALPGPPPPSDALRATIGTLARTRAVARPAPVTCSLDGVSEQQRQASARIAADIAAFEARGGRIERLGPTKFFDRIGMEAANHAPPRRPRTGTLDLDD